MYDIVDDYVRDWGVSYCYILCVVVCGICVVMIVGVCWGFSG